MMSERRPQRASDQPHIYQIIIRGELDGQWSDWFDGFTIMPRPGGETSLVGTVTDQAALYGVLKRIFELGIPLISVNQVDTSEGRQYGGGADGG